MRTYLVVIDDSVESALALRFAARRAARTDGTVHLVAVIEPADFLAWGGAQATIEAEARQKAEDVTASAAEKVRADHGLTARISVRQGDTAAEVRALLAEDDTIAALVLASAASGNPGPLVAHFTGPDSGNLTVPVMIVPGSLSEDDVDRLS